jgi:hypothetical protein
MKIGRRLSVLGTRCQILGRNDQRETSRREQRMASNRMRWLCWPVVVHSTRTGVATLASLIRHRREPPPDHVDRAPRGWRCGREPQPQKRSVAASVRGSCGPQCGFSCLRLTAAVSRASDADHALALANNSATGCAYQNLQLAMRFALELDAGIVHLNGPTIHDEGVVLFGGVKDSGSGREGVADRSRNDRVKWVTIQLGRRAHPF